MFHLHLNAELFVKADCVSSYTPGGDYKCFFELCDLSRDTVTLVLACIEKDIACV